MEKTVFLYPSMNHLIFILFFYLVDMIALEI
jgi:hypothetical protein